MNALVDLSHPIRQGQLTHPGMPAPEWRAFRSREQYRSTTGTEFQVDQVLMVGNTGTYLDSPFHRFPQGRDLAGVPLGQVADLPIVVADVRGRRDVTAGVLRERLRGLALSGAAVLLHTGGDRSWGTPEYAVEAPYLTGEGARWLAERRPALVGIDAVNVDDLADTARPAHTLLLGEEVLVLEHLTGLARLPATGARLHAAPPAWHGVGTWPVRAYALVPPAARRTPSGQRADSSPPDR